MRKILPLILLVLLIFSLNLFSRQTRNFFYSISAPVQKIIWEARRGSDFERELRELRIENQRLLAENVALKEIRSENKILRNALEIGLAEEFQLDFAQVIGKYIDQDAILIDKGAEDGFLENLPVITAEKALVGRIAEVYNDFSRVELISNQASAFDVEILDKDIFALLKGRGRSKVFLDLIPRDKEIQPGDLVVSSSLGGIYPRGLLVGVVESVKKNDVQPFHQAEVSPFFNLQEIKNVFIILKY